ncbi:MAG: DUF3343 domain-containing protein [Oscillospiraceae bacterium]|nr:DUF3343 domain-containing protein [Oscillospiraceae bacterium]
MPVKRELKAVITFSSTTFALEAERLCKKELLPGRLIPVPAVISAGCGMAWCTSPENAENVKALLQRGNVPYEGVTELII